MRARAPTARPQPVERHGDLKEFIASGSAYLQDERADISGAEIAYNVNNGVYTATGDERLDASIEWHPPQSLEHAFTRARLIRYFSHKGLYEVEGMRGSGTPPR